jgi:hypothetical protein
MLDYFPKATPHCEIQVQQHGPSTVETMGEETVLSLLLPHSSPRPVACQCAKICSVIVMGSLAGWLARQGWFPVGLRIRDVLPR